jgi:hypothetical protein
LYHKEGVGIFLIAAFNQGDMLTIAALFFKPAHGKSHSNCGEIISEYIHWEDVSWES